MTAIGLGRLKPTELAELWRPDCMDDEEWADWKSANRRVRSQTQQASRPCTDCTFGFAADMRAEGRCNGTPGGVEEEDEDMDQVISERTEPSRPVEIPTVAVRVTVAAPCGTCTHVAVCRLAADVRKVAETRVAVPVVGEGLQLVLSGAIECEHHEPVRKAGRPRKEATDAPTRQPSGSAVSESWTPERRAAQSERLREANRRRSEQQPAAEA